MRMADHIANPNATARSLQTLLELVCVHVKQRDIMNWTMRQRAHAEEWACQVHLKASDNSHIRLPDKPKFLPEEKDGFSQFLTAVPEIETEASV